MNSTKNQRPFLRPASRVLAACLALGSLSSAQTASTGTIEGRVFNPLTGEYIRRAEVHIQGTAILAVTESDGRYRIANVFPGNVTLAVTYTGYQPATATVTVT